MHGFALAALAVMEEGLRDILARDADALRFFQIGDAAVAHGVRHRTLDLPLEAPQEALAVGDACSCLPACGR
jgi:hypothetical protein